MPEDINKLREKMSELEQELAAKKLENQVYRTQLSQANSQVEKLIHQVSHELKLAAKVQKLLSPTEIPNISGFEISTKFISGVKSGGDYFDIFEHEDKMKFGVLVASCSGYSMSALFLSLLMKLSSQVEARKGLSPLDFIKMVSKEMSSQMGAKDRASLFYGVIDKRNFELEYCGAGSIEVFIETKKTAELIHLEQYPQAISNQSQPALGSVKVELNSKDRLILVSEGVVNTKNSQIQTWGRESLKRAILAAPKSGVHELRNEILFSNQKFSGTTEPDRDQTVVILEVNEKILKLA